MCSAKIVAFAGSEDGGAPRCGITGSPDGVDYGGGACCARIPPVIFTPRASSKLLQRKRAGLGGLGHRKIELHWRCVQRNCPAQQNKIRPRLPDHRKF